MKIRHIMALMLLPCLSCCVDDNYDLANVETTIQVNVDNLTIPINIDQITLDDIITLKEDGDVKIVDGQYAIVKEGEFTSASVEIPRIHLQAPVLDPTITPISLINLPTSSTRAAMPSSFTYDIANEGHDIVFEAAMVSQFIVSIEHLGCKLTLGMDISLSGLENVVKRVTFTDVILQLPKGLDLVSAQGGTYNKVTGQLALPNATVSGTSMSIQLEATGVDFKMIGGEYNYEKQTISVTGSMFILQGYATINAADITSIPQSSATLRTDYIISDTEVTTFTGNVKYTVDQASLSNVDLGSLPDVLAQKETDISFLNPQIYLHIKNPLQQYHMYARTGLDITAYHGEDSQTYSLNDPYFKIGPDNANGIYNFCLSPQKPATTQPGFEDAQHVPFTSLSNVLSGDGIPDRLDINLADPCVPEQHVEEMVLGQDLGALGGTYRFIVPLQFNPGSTVTYVHIIDGWSSEDLDDLTITQLKVDLLISTNVAVDVDFTGYPINKEGKQIDSVEILGAKVPANAKNYPLTLYITGTIRHLDGIRFEAKAVAQDMDSPLSPDQTVTLTDIRPTASGYYERKL